MRTERAAGSRPAGWLSLVGLVLVPLLVAGGFLWATWKSDTRLDRVQAAIVNLDEPVKLNGQTVPLGRQLAGGLVTGGESSAADDKDADPEADSDADKNFDWLLTDEDDAEDGLAAGRYAAVVTIPKNFSARATSFSKTDPDQIGPAEIQVQTSQIRGIADTVVGQSIAAAATAALNTQLTEQYLDNIYVGFNETGKQFTTVAKAAGQLSDGTTQLADGIGKSATGAGKLADGLDQLDDGTKKLAGGAGQLSTGTRQLATGLDQLADGTSALPSQVRKLANGADASADGTKKLASGAKKLSRGMNTYAAGAGEAATGAKKFSKGLTQYTGGVSGLNTGLRAYQKGIQQLAQDGPPSSVRSQLCPTGTPAEACALLEAGFKAGAGAAAAGLTQKSNGQSLISGAAALADNGSAISTGGKKLAAGVDGLADGADELAGGVQGVATGTGQLSSGLRQLADGTDQLADGLKPLATGIRKTSTGASSLADGASQLSTGVAGLRTGTRQSAAGASQLAGGLDQLSDGGTKLADGAKQLAGGLKKGADQVPSYDKTTRTKLAEVVATPVTAERPDTLFSDVANTTFLAVLALWLGALATFVVLRAVPARVLTSMKPSWRLALEALLPGAAIAGVQAVALTVVLQLLLGLSAARVGALVPLLVLAGLAYAAVNQALVAWLGGTGRFVSVILGVLSAAAAITAAIPAAFETLLPFLPMTPALEGVRAVVTGGTGALGAAGLLGAWLVVGVAASVLAVARRRILPAGAPATVI